MFVFVKTWSLFVHKIQFHKKSLPLMALASEFLKARSGCAFFYSCWVLLKVPTLLDAREGDGACATCVMGDQIE